MNPVLNKKIIDEIKSMVMDNNLTVFYFYFIKQYLKFLFSRYPLIMFPRNFKFIFPMLSSNPFYFNYSIFY